MPARKSSLGQQQVALPVQLPQRPELMQNVNYGYILTNHTASNTPEGGGGGSVISGTNESLANVPLNKCEWYFSDCDRDFVRKKLKGTRDGTFLVRDSTSGNGEYTLTLKKDGEDRMIKIYNNNGQYGFTKGGVGGLDFASVPELVNYYRNTSLKDYNRILDIKLLYPVSRYANQEEEWRNIDDIDKLVKTYLDLRKDLTAREKEYDENHSKYKRIEHDLDIKRQAFEAFAEAEMLFEEQLSTQKRYQVEAQPHEVPRLKDNMDLLKERLKQLMQCKQELSKSYDMQKGLFLQLERNIQSLNPMLTNLRNSENQYLK